jgi:hypothetical protein
MEKEHLYEPSLTSDEEIETTQSYKIENLFRDRKRLFSTCR